MATPTSSGSTTAVPRSTSATVAALAWTSKWGGALGTGATLTFSFPGAGSYWSADAIAGYGPTSDGTSEPWNIDFLPTADVDRPGIRAALRAWSTVANVRLTEVADTISSAGDIRFAYTGAVDPDTLAHAYLPARTAYAGDVWLNVHEYTGHFLAITRGNSAFHTVLHESGHALGLKHPFEGPVRLPAATDHYKYTVMSYNVGPGVADNGSLTQYPTTPMSYDIAAIQYLYGANTATRTGNDTYTYDGDSRYFETIWDAGGSDLLRVTGTRDAVVDLNPGRWSALGLPIGYDDGTGAVTDPWTVQIYRTVIIEHAAGGAGADRLVGNAYANRLYGGAGNDTLVGAYGNDLLSGGAGDDVLSGGVGVDTLNGGDGNDTYAIDAADAAIVDAGGIDTVRTALAYTLPSALENLVLLGSAALAGTGNARANSLLGNAAANTLRGLGGDDILEGAGGADVLTGGAGADTFAFNAAPTGQIDRITDFLSGTDGLRLSALAFGALAPGAGAPLADGLLAIGAAAADGDDFLVFNPATRVLGYDADGSGPGALLAFARLENATLLASDVFIATV